MYPKGGNMLHSIRHSLGDDTLFRKIMRGLNETFYHKTVTAEEIENYISRQGGFDYSKVFKQYLETTQIPALELKVKGNKISFRYTNCIKGFNLPLVLDSAETKLKIKPTQKWKTIKVKNNESALLQQKAIENMYYLQVRMVE
jgi:aminopeptidase N